ncbi:MAG: BT0820 family HAD-type phosphatase [Flavicella sp.]
MSSIHHSVIAVDFDGTIVEDAYPKIGKPKLFAFDTIKKLQKNGHRIILWTVRSGKSLDKAVAFCKDKGVEFYAVNKNYPEEIVDANTPRKILADTFIDDRNVGGFMGWDKINQLFFENESLPKIKKKNLFSFFKK